jgi:hypothetical protein
MNKEQTAVDWLINAIEANMDDIPFEVKQQAKVMFQEQIQEAFNQGYECNEVDEIFEIKETMFSAEGYYNKKYGGDTIQNNIMDKDQQYEFGKDKFEKFLDAEMKLGISDKKTIERIRWYYEEFFKDTIFYEQ